MASESQRNDNAFAKEMIEHLALLSRAMDEYFEIPSMTVIDTSTHSAGDVPREIPEQLQSRKQG